eukprot:5601710-Pleurochrysis_carterae.AAC.1
MALRLPRRHEHECQRCLSVRRNEGGGNEHARGCRGARARARSRSRAASSHSAEIGENRSE